MKSLVVIKDFVDVAGAEIRGTILRHLKNKDIFIEPIVPIKPFSVINGNFILRLLADSYPEGTIFSVILNPLQKRPERLIGRTSVGNFLFMGANTGVFSWLMRDFGFKELYEYRDPGFLPFGGKYVHAPAVAKIASGEPLESLGDVFPEKNVLTLNIPDGVVVHVDNFGLIKFTGNLSASEGDIFNVTVNSHVIEAIYSTRMMSLPDDTWVLYPGSSLGLPELGLVRRNGASVLGVKEGDIVLFKKK